MDRWHRLNVMWSVKVAAARTRHRSVADLDNWLAEQFRRHGKHVDHLLFACRSILAAAPAAAPANRGVKGLCTAFLKKAYDHGPSGFTDDVLARLSSGFARMVAGGSGVSMVPLAGALAMCHGSELGRQHPRWWAYCCSQLAEKNDGLVDLDAVDAYMRRAMAKHPKGAKPRVDGWL